MTRLTDAVEGIIHEPTQTEGRGLDLTVADVREVTGPGRLDFGGGELEPAETDPHERQYLNPDDDYEWWPLEAGQYLLEYNESLADGVTVQVQPRRELLARGASHPSLVADELGPVPLSVGGAGVRIKENARVSTVVDVEDD